MDGTVDPSALPNALQQKAYLSVHRSLIFLGDIARYHRDLYDEDTEKDWSQAFKLYEQVVRFVFFVALGAKKPHSNLSGSCSLPLSW